jgi:hypothetical protein
MAGGWGAGAYGILTPEVTFGTYNSGGTPLYPRLVSDTALLAQSDPQRRLIMSADGGNRPVQVVAGRNLLTAKLHTALYPTQAQAYLDWACNISGGDLPSYTLDLFDTVDKTRNVGMKVKQLTLQCGKDQDEGIVWADLDLVGQQVLGTPPTLSAPAFASYPAENPYIHQESAGAFTLGSSRASWAGFKVTVTNILVVDNEEFAYASAITYCGRTIAIGADFKYLAAADRTAYEAQTAQACSIEFTKASPAHTLTLGFQGQGRVSKRTRTLPLGGIARQSIDYDGFYDNTNASDFIYTVT